MDKSKISKAKLWVALTCALFCAICAFICLSTQIAYADEGECEKFGPYSDAELLAPALQYDSAYLPSNKEGWQESSRGVQYYKNGSPIKGWLVDANYKNYGLQRYFFDSDSYLVKSRAITDDEAGYWAYARPEGYVVRGTYDNGAARVFLADNDGRLPDDSGWLVTGKFTDGVLQRYYIDEDTHGAKSSFFDVGEQRYWGEGGCGYVLRGNAIRANQRISANNDGKLLKEGWLCTSDYGQDFQRYWFSNYTVPSAGAYCTGGSAWTYVTNSGPVLRGTYDNGAARVYLANNDGVLASQEGWLVTGAYTGGVLQRYYIDGVAHAAKSAFFEVDGNRYWGEGGCGYVLRGNASRGGKLISANNDGKLLKEGWLCTSDFGQGLQRYWFSDYSVPKEGHYLTSGTSTTKVYTYVTSSGYVLRGTHDNGAGHVYLANNDGVLASTPGWLITGAYTGGVLQRYYIDNTMPAAKTSIFDVGDHKYYGIGGVGYVLRGVMDNGYGHVFLADNEGVLESTPGWLCTSKYAGSPQRYYIDPDYPAAKTSFFNIKGSNYYGQGGVGYVLRGKMRYGAGILLADNDGKLESNEGWLVTNKYDGHIERYRIDRSCDGHMGAHCGLFSLDGNLYYGRDDQGYVVRNDKMFIHPRIYWANNDGVLVWQNFSANVGPLYQNPELPSGCEPCALTIALRAMGYNIDKFTICDNYMPYSGSDFVNAYWGNPRGSGGTMAPCIATSANNFLASHGSPYRAYDVSGSSFEQLVEYANNGIPVVIWTTMYMASPNFTGQWCCGRQWYRNEHAVCMFGAGGGAVSVSDSLSGMVARDYNAFRNLYYQCGGMAVIMH